MQLRDLQETIFLVYQVTIQSTNSFKDNWNLHNRNDSNEIARFFTFGARILNPLTIIWKASLSVDNRAFCIAINDIIDKFHFTDGLGPMQYMYCFKQIYYTRIDSRLNTNPTHNHRRQSVEKSVFYRALNDILKKIHFGGFLNFMVAFDQKN